MEEQILFAQPYESSPELSAVETYLNRFLGIQIKGFVFTRGDSRTESLIVDDKPIRHAVVRDNQQQLVNVSWQKQKIFPPAEGWLSRGYSITYACGYGELVDALPANLVSDYQTALSTDLSLPEDIELAIRLVRETFDDREGRRFDIQSQSQELGSTQYISAIYKATIPTEIRGLLMNHRKIAI